MIVSLGMGKNVCIKEIQNGFGDAFLSIELSRALERAILESGLGIACPGREISLKVEEFKLLPMGISPSQRANFYELRLVFRLKSQELEREVMIRKSFFQESGSVADLPMREAILDAIKLGMFDIIQFTRRVKDADKANE